MLKLHHCSYTRALDYHIRFFDPFGKGRPEWYLVQFSDFNEVMRTISTTAVAVKFCPWCGEELQRLE